MCAEDERQGRIRRLDVGKIAGLRDGGSRQESNETGAAEQRAQQPEQQGTGSGGLGSSPAERLEREQRRVDVDPVRSQLV